ncbi:MAG TPA: PhzF family phenazine biosynthesis protein [Pseudomonadales bacterium]
MIVQSEYQYSVFGSATFPGNPVTLFELDALDDSAAILSAAKHSRTEDNVFFSVTDAQAVMARFFSSRAELWLCGHGLLALSHHLCTPGSTDARTVHSPFGAWRIHADEQGPGVLMPAQSGCEIVDSKHWMNGALRSSGIEHERLYQCRNDVWVAVLGDMEKLRTIEAKRVAALPCGNDTPGALIAALPLPDSGYGFRYFAPWHGKPEDSGTGSAHCYLAPLLLGSRAPVRALQFSPGGVAEMRIALRGSTVAVSGRVVPHT